MRTHLVQAEEMGNMMIMDILVNAGALVDFSYALVYAEMNVFNRMNITEYLQYVFNVINGKVSYDNMVSHSFLRICCAHMIKAVASNLNGKCGLCSYLEDLAPLRVNYGVIERHPWFNIGVYGAVFGRIVSSSSSSSSVKMPLQYTVLKPNLVLLFATDAVGRAVSSVCAAHVLTARNIS